MAKKTKKSKPAKKAAKSAKKIVAKKKPAKKISNKKAAPKKAKKSVKKIVKKKTVAKKVKTKKSKSVKKVAAKKVLKAKNQKPVKVVSKKSVEKKKTTVQEKQVKPVIAAKAKSEANQKKNTSHSQGFVKKGDFVIDKRPISELNLNMSAPLIKRIEQPKPKPQVSTDKRTRYSDKELQEFKQIILRKLDEAKKDYELLKSTLSHKDDHGTDDTSPTFKLLEDGSDVLSKEETAQLAGRQEKFIQSLQNALIRIENKTYGICRVTGKLISKERLRSVPHATLAIEAKLEQASAQ